MGRGKKGTVTKNEVEKARNKSKHEARWATMCRVSVRYKSCVRGEDKVEISPDSDEGRIRGNTVFIRTRI